MKKNTYYFSHDYNAHNDTKILFLRQQLGMEGYGIYWFLVESLADAGGTLPMKIIPVLSMQMHTTEVKVNAVIKQFELFEIENENFFSIRLNNHLNKRNELSEKGKDGAAKRWGNGEANGVAIGEGNAKERKGNKSKGKEIKEVIELPFNNIDFSNKWNEWKEYKKTQHKFQFKSTTTEKTALNNLLKLSNNNCEIALQIINQSIANGWKGFFEIKNLINDKPANEKRFEAYLEYANRYQKSFDDEAYQGL